MKGLGSYMLAVAIVAPFVSAGENMPQTLSIISFERNDTVEWVAIHDVVMGGVSSGGIERTDRGTGMFSGKLSLENNGGFASVRALVGEQDLSSFGGLAIRVRGDGRRYQLRLRVDDRFDGIAYAASFESKTDEWSEHRIPFAEFRPTFRGRTPRDAPPLDTSRIFQLGLMLADKNPGSFSLEIDWIRAWSDDG